MNVLELNPSEVAPASQTLTRAFFNYPDLSYYFPDLKKRPAQLYWLLHCGVVQADRVGKVFKTEDSSGIMAVQLPGSRQLNFWDQLMSGVFKAPFIMNRASFDRMRFCEAYTLEKHHQVMASIPHYYVWYLGVEPGTQGKGVGSTLIRHVQALAGRSKHPVYLETHLPSTVAYYQHLGFSKMAENQIPGHPIVFTNMLWEPA